MFCQSLQTLSHVLYLQEIGLIVYKERGCHWWRFYCCYYHFYSLSWLIHCVLALLSLCLLGDIERPTGVQIMPSAVIFDLRVLMMIFPQVLYQHCSLCDDLYQWLIYVLSLATDHVSSFSYHVRSSRTFCLLTFAFEGKCDELLAGLALHSANWVQVQCLASFCSTHHTMPASHSDNMAGWKEFWLSL